MSNSYVIFAGDSQNCLEPIVSAPNKKAAIIEAKVLEEKYTCVEAIFMPEYNTNINKVVYHNNKMASLI